MLTQSEQDDILQLIRQQVVPAIGCTEPIAVALCVAKARELLGVIPEKIEVKLSANILKNAMGVGIPGTGMIGLPIAVALGALIGKSEQQLEVLKNCNKEAVKAGRAFIDEGRIDIQLEKATTEKLYINVVCQAQGQEAEARIMATHTNFVWLRKGEEVLLNREVCSAESLPKSHVELSMRKVYEFATETDIEQLRFILEAKTLNENASKKGMEDNYGHQLGKTMCSPLGKGVLGDSVYAHILASTGSACDARMAGAMVPVMSNSGSGNQGICTTVPVTTFARENHNTEEELIRALILSNLTAIYIKQHLGTLSALCGCVVASTGSSCGITYLMGGNYDQIAFSVKNMIANLTGMICDGAKPSCALKLTTGVSTGVMSALLAMQHKCVTSVEGIIDDDVDKSIRNLTAIGSKGMDETDKYVLDIMTSKTAHK
ncbi:MAG: L-serine ammonia-lyase, iron-sulfur-dependent, subunit alpha [Prevotellaceae bacterium]|nr:L-serine ammonia-lyase, iron-sulfur-dependent, subunit alpha [Prevotellaceae bacterium]MDY3364876.1 L-serine ammonia-lyase, iron-sulfur-dependent, subunit alpha [Prevotella sp.]